MLPNACEKNFSSANPLLARVNKPLWRAAMALSSAPSRFESEPKSDRVNVDASQQRLDVAR